MSNKNITGVLSLIIIVPCFMLSLYGFFTQSPSQTTTGAVASGVSETIDRNQPFQFFQKRKNALEESEKRMVAKKPFESFTVHSKKIKKQAKITRYVISTRGDEWFFRNKKCEWVGKFYPSNPEEREAAFKCDRKVNCGDYKGACKTNASGKTPQPHRDVACDQNNWKFGDEFIINGKTYVCNDVGGAIKDGDNYVRLDVLVTKDTWEETSDISTPGNTTREIIIKIKQKKLNKHEI